MKFQIRIETHHHVHRPTNIHFEYSWATCIEKFLTWNSTS